MQTFELQRLADSLAKRDESKLIALGLRGTSLQEIEDFRYRRGGVFGSRSGRHFQLKNGLWGYETTSDWQYDHNIVTNVGLAYVINVAFDNTADIDTWYVILSNTNTSPAATMTYATPVFTEATTTNLDEATRQAWVEGNVSGTTTASISNSASPAVYTGDNSFTAYGAALVGGGTDPTVISDTAGGGTLYCFSLFASSKALTVDDTIEVTYTVNATDDGV